MSIAFEAGAGVTALFGPSGAGKTTIMLALTGLLSPEAGRIVLGERVLFDHGARIDVRPEHRRVALVFQNLSLFPHMSALANVAYGVRGAKERAEREARARAWLARMRVGHVAERTPGTFSGGEAQRVALARALASEPEALLLDEPFSALDASLRVELADELREVLKERPMPVILVTHDRADAARLAERTIALG